MSVAAHRDLPHANPLSPAQYDALVHAVAAARPRRVLEVGCGWGSFALALAQACDTEILAVDINDEFLARGRALAAGRALAGRIEFRNTPAEAIDERFDAVVCIGASQAFGTTRVALERCAALLETDGLLVFADGVWATEPAREFLDFLGAERSTYWLQSDATAVFASAGLAIREQAVTSAASWQAYEEEIERGRLRFAATLDEREADEVRARVSTWSAARERWVREGLGFVGYVAQRAR